MTEENNNGIPTDLPGARVIEELAQFAFEPVDDNLTLGDAVRGNLPLKITGPAQYLIATFEAGIEALGVKHEGVRGYDSEGNLIHEEVAPGGTKFDD